METKKVSKIKVVALPALLERRYITLDVKFNVKTFRQLQQGESVLINKEDFDPLLFKEVKDDERGYFCLSKSTRFIHNLFSPGWCTKC